MKGLHVEITLLAGLFLIMVGLLVLGHVLGMTQPVGEKFMEWGALILGALLLAVKGRTDKPE